MSEWTAWEALEDYPLDDERRELLLARQLECAVVWTNSAAEPVGVMHWFVWKDGRFWVTSGSHRKRVPALRSRPQSCVIVSGAGTDLGPSITVTAKTLATVHDSGPGPDWFFHALAIKAHGETPTAATFEAMLGATERVVIELVPTAFITYDASRMHRAIIGAARKSPAP